MLLEDGKVLNSMKKFIFIIILFCLSCNQFKYNRLVGKYKYIQPNFYYGEMELKADSIFNFYYQAGLMSSHVTGKWNLDNNKLILNSSMQPDTDSILVQESYNENQSQIKIYVRDKKEEPLGAAFVYFNNDTKIGVACDDDGNLFIPDTLRLNSIHINYIGEIYNYAIKFPNSNNFNIHVNFNPKYEWYRFFINEIWDIKKKKIINPNGNEFCK